MPLELLESLRGDRIPCVLRVVVQDDLSPGATTPLVTPLSQWVQSTPALQQSHCSATACRLWAPSARTGTRAWSSAAFKNAETPAVPAFW